MLTTLFQTVLLLPIPVLLRTTFSNKIGGIIGILDARLVHMIISILSYYIILTLTLFFNFNNPEFQFRFSLFDLSFGLDGLNLSLLLLLSFLYPILILISNTEAFNSRFHSFLALLSFFLLLFFSTLDFFVFFFSFEFLFIPMFLLMALWGSSYSFFLPRLEAIFRFFFFTLFGSLFFLISFFILLLSFGTTNLEFLFFSLSSSHFHVLFSFLWIFFFFSFLLKIPMFPFHTWLPLVHSDAPTIGSVLLAAILLKLASYGIFRFNLFLFSPISLFDSFSSLGEAYLFFLPFIFLFASLSIFYCSLIPLRSLFDFKKIIAYSSIVHMNFSLFGFFSFDFSGLLAAALLLFSHAFISSALFLLIGFLYQRSHSRFFPYFQGLASFLPLFSSFFLFFSIANFSIPFCVSFLPEFFLLSSSFFFNPLLSFLLLVSLILSSSFILWFANRLLFGLPSRFSLSLLDLSLLEFFSLIPFLFVSLFFAFFTHFFHFFSLPLFFLL